MNTKSDCTVAASASTHKHRPHSLSASPASVQCRCACEHLVELLLGVGDFPLARDAQHRVAALEEREQLRCLFLQRVLRVFERVARHALGLALDEHIHGGGEVHERAHRDPRVLESQELLRDVRRDAVLHSREAVDQVRRERSGGDEALQLHESVSERSGGFIRLWRPPARAQAQVPYHVTLRTRLHGVSVERVRVADDTEQLRLQLATKLLVDLIDAEKRELDGHRRALAAAFAGLERGEDRQQLLQVRRQRSAVLLLLLALSLELLFVVRVAVVVVVALGGS